MSIAKVENKFFYFKFTVHSPTLRKVDRNATASAEKAHGATHGSGAFIKNLVDAGIKRTLDSAQVAARNAANDLTYSFDGNYRLGLIEDIDKVMMNAREARDELVLTWERVLLNSETYDDAIDRHRIALGTMYNAVEVPSLDNLKRKFWIEIDVRPVQDIGKGFSVLGVANDEILRIEKETTERVTKAFENATDSLKADARKSLARLLEAIEKIDGNAKTKVHGSLLTGLEEIANKIDAVGGFGNPALQGVVREIREKMACQSTVQLKHSDKTRATMKLAARAALDSMQSTVIEPGAKGIVDNLQGMTF